MVLQQYPETLSSQEEAQQLVANARQLRVEYQDTRNQYLLRLKQVLDDIRRADFHLFQVDSHIGRLQHLICKSGFQEIPPIIDHPRQDVVVNGGEHY